MMRPIALTTMTLWVGLAGTSGRAEHAKINLDVVAPSGQQTAFVDQTPPESGKNPRPVLKAKAGEPIKIQWMFTNVYPHKTLENVVVHFFIARAGQGGPEGTPRPDGGRGARNRLRHGLQARGQGGGRNTVRIDAPGAYLIRVESRQTGSDHEHFAAIDLVIEGETP